MLKLINLILLVLVVSFSHVNAQEITKKSKLEEFCSFKGTLKFKDVNPNVNLLQDVLTVNNFLSPIVRTSYDLETKKAVSDFQSKYKISKTGNVGPQTLNKMKSLWCGDFIKKGEITLPANVINYLGGGIVELRTDELCKIKNSVIEWGDGDIHQIGDISKYIACESILHRYKSDNKYTILVRSNSDGKVTHKINVNGNLFDQINVFIINFSINKVSNGYEFSWKSAKANQCHILKEGSTEIINVPIIGTKVMQVNPGEVYELHCFDVEGVESIFKAVVGPDSANSKFMIKQFAQVVTKNKSYAVWRLSSNVKNCLVDSTNTNVDDWAEIIVGRKFSIKMECYSGGQSVEETLVFDPHLGTPSPKILNFSSEVKGDTAKILWETKDAIRCTLYGGPFGERQEYSLRKLTGSEEMYLNTDNIKLTMWCYGSDGKGVTKEIYVKK